MERLKMIIYKFFALGEYEKKEKWINDMCSKGYALQSFGFCIYKFDSCEPGEYYYSLELLENLHSSPRNEDFFNYLEDEWSVEFVSSYYNWVFFRRKKSLGRFSLFPNVHTKTAYFKRIISFRFTLIIFLIFMGLLDYVSSIPGSTDKSFSFIIFLISLVAFTINMPTFINFIKLKKSDDY